jgi:hypothetical protein
LASFAILCFFAIHHNFVPRQAFLSFYSINILIAAFANLIKRCITLQPLVMPLLCRFNVMTLKNY